MPPTRHLAVTALALTALTGAACRVGPQYTKPAISTPPAYKEIADPGSDAWRPSQPSDDVDRGEWWTRFEDPRLNELEASIDISNQNVAAAVASLLSSRAIIREARAQFFPTVGVGVGLGNTRVSTIFGTTQQAAYAVYDLPLTASWEPDLWGSVRNTVAADEFAAQISAATLENVRLSAQADLAATYFQLRASDALIQILDSTVSTYQEAYTFNRDLRDAGLASDEEVAQAEAQLRGAEAQASNARIARAQYEHAIAVLTGEFPSDFTIPAGALDAVPPALPVGVPSELLERRPDVAAAERAVAQANAQVGLAETAFFPSLLLGFTGGLQSPTLSDWLTWPARYWTVGPTLLQTVFDGGLREATVQQFKATYDETVANYRQTVLTAFQEVEDNLAALRILSEVVAQQDAAVEAAQRNLDVTMARFDAGLDPYLNVVVARNLLLSYQQASVAFRMQQMVAAVQLVKSLGGGWDTSELPSPESLSEKPPQ